ncbi:MAG: T9SS type A sorting domain-containing protein [Bacteroidetes bacterium]|nr:MAG: T9SS type A sorting domain-containing protein [Bacteroidota bacterium]
MVPMKHFLPFLFFLLFGVALQAQNANKPDLTVYPNPTTDYISVKDNNDVVGYVAVFNLVGKKLKEFDFVKGESLFVADLPKNIYLVQIQDHDRRVLKTQKVNKR